ncbi:MAG: type II toxin-antitoxin system HicB family antitoxin [Pseudonocardiaceae bacterium]
MNPDYRIEVFWSDEDEVWIADVPNLPMCSAHGLAPHEAVAEVEQAIEAWLGRSSCHGSASSEAVQPGRPGLMFAAW